MGEWKKTALSEVIELIGGGTPKTSIAEYWNGDLPWLSVADFNTGRKYIYGAEKNITQLGLEKSSTKLLQVGDIIISARGTVGVVAAIPVMIINACSKNITFLYFRKDYM
jgi:type I restriction enzyme S subunit